MENNKEQFVKKLEAVIKLTECDLFRLALTDDGKHIIITYRNGYTKLVNIDGDSMISIIYDVIRKI